VGGLECWPSEPHWDQLVGGAALAARQVDFESHWCTHRGPTSATRRGVDFDRVVLALDLGSIKRLNAADGSVCQELLDHWPKLRQMAEDAPLVPSGALQLWVDRELPALGWAPREAPAMVSWANPMDVWAAMPETLAHEPWTGQRKPLGAHYFCGVLASEAHLQPANPGDGQDVQQEADAALRAQIEVQLGRHTRTIWPNAVAADGSFRWELLVAPDGVRGAARLDHQFIRANVGPAECCVGSPPGLSRPRADEAPLVNLTLCGNWIRTGLDATCVEAATMSGMAAARAISGEALEIVGEAFFTGAPRHPTPARRAPATGMPAYVSAIGRGEQVIAPPGQFTGRVHAFVCPADRAAMTALARRYLSEPSGGQLDFTAAAPFMLVTFMDALVGSSAEPIGQVASRECALWIVLHEHVPGSTLPRLRYWMPTIFIDSSIGMATGREVWGFRKEMAAVRIPGASDPRARFVAEPTLFREFGATVRARTESLLVIEQDGPLGALGPAWRSVAEAGEHLAGQLFGRLGAGLVGAGRIVGGIAARLGLAQHAPSLHPELSVVNLKQFRDVADPTRACYQAVVAAPIRVQRLHAGGPLLGDYHLRVTPCASHTIVEDFGLAGACVPVRFAVWADVVFEANAGVELWRHGAAVHGAGAS
jgi:hypothetical protein